MLLPLSKSWYIHPRLSETEFARFPDLHPLIVQILHNRKIEEPDQVRDFLARRSSDDADPFRLKGMPEAVTRLHQAIEAGDLIAIYGDYDADGVTATALMTHVLKALGGKVLPYIPNRFEEGYGLNKRALTYLAGQGARVVLTVDCGVRSVQEVVHGNQLGLDIIITDHHHFVAERIPPALAIINPKQPDCDYPFDQLSGVGLAYKLAQALTCAGAQPGCQAAGIPDSLLDLVALGTVADLAPLLGENRALVARGLEQLNAPQRPGLQMLMAQAGVRPGRVDASTIAFGLGPRLNAAGRLEDAQAAYELLVTEDIFRAGQLAQQLDSQNRERQSLTQAAVELARQIILDDVSRPLYLIAHPEFNTGIVGLVSSRLTEEFYRPTLVARQGERETRGSARSIPGFHITEALDECSHLLERYGGHSAAAGFTIRNENLPEFEARLLAIAERKLADVDLVPPLEIDAELNLRGFNRRRVEDLLSAQAVGRAIDESDVGLQIILGLERLRPFGEGNPHPVFVSYGLEVKGKRQVGSDGGHLKLVLHDGRQTWDAIAFRMGDWHDRLPPRVDVAYTLEINNWDSGPDGGARTGGRQRLQLNVQDIRPAGLVEA
ncbi:MAG: single-stranded-DNA-specific exonuclease RecJ [Anaerolineae bacterium]